MLAARLRTDTPVDPFGLQARDLPVGEGSLADAQARAVAAAGLRLHEGPPPAGEPALLFTDRTWMTAGALRQLADAARSGRWGRVEITDPAWWEVFGPLQRLGPGQTELGARPAGGPDAIDALPPLPLDLGLKTPPLPAPHPRLRHVVRPLRLGPRMVHGVWHWTHLNRVNQLVLTAWAEEMAEGWQQAGLARRAGVLIRLLARARSLQPARIARAFSELHPRARVHPAAVVEGSRVGDGAEVGAFAVVRGSVLGAGAVVGDHATVVGSVMGAGARVGPYAHLAFSTMFPEARVSAGDGFQFCVFGEACFVAWGAAALDISFGREVRVEDGGARVPSGHHMLGVCVGPRAVVGQGVRILHGATVPADALLIADPDDLFRGAPPAGMGADPHFVRGGALRAWRPRGGSAPGD
jgi:carbonic anhydrase/acetyltransferase-like protein (isoleucine patch superfamily)